jgi:hypothetical protein
VFNVDTVNGNVGIGTAAPTGKLDVNGMLVVTGVSIPTTGAGVNIYYDGSNGIIDSYNWATSTRLPLEIFGTPIRLLGGNVGIATNAPTSTLHVRGISQLGTISNTLWAANVTFPAAQLSGNTSYANVTSALARARAPQAVTYSGTNVYTDARLGPFFRVNATNGFRLHQPTNATDGQALKWWIKQHVGGTNTITLVASEFVIPIGASTPVLSVTNGCVDVLAGEWDGVNSRVRVQSYMRYAQ